MKEILFRIRVNVQQEKELERINRRINELIVLKKKNKGLTVKEGIELKSLRKDYNALTNQIIKQNQVRKGEINTLGRINAQLAIERQRIKDVVIGSKEFNTVAARIKNMENKQRAANAAMGRGTTFVGEYAKGAIQAFQKIAAGVMAAVIALRSMSRVFKGIIDTLTEFEQGQMNVQTLLEDFDEELRDESIELMRKYGLAINDTNRALFDAVSAGVAVRESYGFMNDAAILAIAGVSDMESVVDGMTTVMNVWNLSLDDMSRVSAAFFTAQKKGKFYISDITSEIGKSASMAKIAGMSYQELMTTYAELTKKGLPLQESTTAIKAIIKGVTAPSKEAEAAFKDLEIQTGLTAVSEQGLFTILSKINQATKIKKDRLTELLPNVRAITGAAALNEEALKDWHEILKLVNEDFGEGSSLMEQYANQMGTMAKKKQLLTASWKSLILATEEGNAIGKLWSSILVGLTNATDALRIMSDKSNKLTREQRIETYLLLNAEQELALQRTKSSGELTSWFEKLKKLEEEEELRKAEAEEARKLRHEAQQKDEQQAFDDQILRLQMLFEEEQAFDAAAMAEFYATQEAKKEFSEQINTEITESLEKSLDDQLKAQQKKWDKEEKEEKEAVKRIEDRAGLITKIASDIGVAIENALLAEKNQFKEFSKGLILASLSTLKRIADMAIAEATIRSLARYGIIRGTIRAGLIAVGIEAAYGTARALVMKMNRGGEVYGQGNRDTVPAMLTPGEGVINKRSMQNSDVMTLTGTPYDIASQINSYRGFGIPFAAGGVAPSVTNNTFNNIDEGSMNRIISGMNDRELKVILNVNEVTAAQNEIDVINQTGEI